MGVEELRQALAGSHLLLLDTLVFSYHFGAHPDFAPLTGLILERVEGGRVRALATTLTVAELLTRPAQEGNLEALRDYRLYLTNFPNLQIVPLAVPLAERAALVRARTQLGMRDALQIAAAQLYEADTIITNDRTWVGRFAAPAVLILDDYR